MSKKYLILIGCVDIFETKLFLITKIKLKSLHKTRLNCYKTTASLKTLYFIIVLYFETPNKNYILTPFSSKEGTISIPAFY